MPEEVTAQLGKRILPILGESSCNIVFVRCNLLQRSLEPSSAATFFVEPLGLSVAGLCGHQLGAWPADK